MTSTSLLKDREASPVDWSRSHRVACPECGKRTKVKERWWGGGWEWLECEDGHTLTGRRIVPYRGPWDVAYPLSTYYYMGRVLVAIRELGLMDDNLNEAIVEAFDDSVVMDQDSMF